MNENSNAKWLIAVSVAVVWVFAIYATYYWAHKPFSGANLVILLDIVVWLGLLLASLLWQPLMIARYALPAAVPGLLLPLIIAQRLLKPLVHFLAELVCSPAGQEVRPPC